MRKLLIATLLLASFLAHAKHLRIPEMRIKIQSLNEQIDDVEEIFQKDASVLSQFLDARKKDIKLERLSIDDAYELFNDLEERNTIPFGYSKDGCYARAHRMARIAMWKGINVGKIFIKGSLDPFLTDNWKWRYHVAPFVIIRHNNIDQVLVIDPSLFNSPVSVSIWVDKTVGQGESRNSPLQIALRRRTAYDLSDMYGRTKTFFSIIDLINTGRTLRRYRN